MNVHPELNRPVRLSWKSLCILILVGLAVYVNALPGTFIWDDYLLVADNPAIRTWDNLPKILTGNLTVDNPHYRLTSSSYRPLQSVTYMLDYSLWQLKPWGYHLTNILLHIGAALSLYYVLILMLKNARVAFWSALLFIVHPVQTEAVTYISGRADALAALFIFGTGIFYLKHNESRRVVFAILMALSFGLALGSREIALITPVWLLTVHWACAHRVNKQGMAVLLFMSIVYAGLRLTETVGQLGGTEQAVVPFMQRCPGFFAAITQYALLLFAPVHLHMEYGKPVFAYTNPMVLVGVIICMAMIVTAIRARRSYPWVSLGLAWFFVFLFPVSNTVFRVNAYMAEHWLYIPAVGIFIIGSTCILALAERIHKPALGVIGLSVTVLILAGVSIKQNLVWRDSQTFFKYTLHYAPYSARAHADFGYAYTREGKYDQAIESYKQSITIDPTYLDAYNNLGDAYVKLKRYNDAIVILNKALDIAPDMEYLYYNRALAYYHSRQIDKAIDDFQRGIALNPERSTAYPVYGAMLFNLGRKEESLIMVQKALIINPHNPKAQALYKELML